MLTYRFPLRDVRFVLEQVIGLDRVTSLPAYQDLDADTVHAVAEAFGAFAAETLLPLNGVGDREGCRLEEGRVQTPSGFAAAYEAFREGGWNGLPCDPAFGGQGLPHLLHAVMREAMTGSNLALSLLHDLNFGVYKALNAHGSEALKARFLDKIVDGTWTGTMCLTEPHCGTDLGLVRTRARPAGEGLWALTGTKIFITWGDHDAAENILHLVLARIEGAPAGVKGLSLFLVPRLLSDDEGRLTTVNGAEPVGVEDKMGIHGSPTCTMAFEDALGWLVGEEGQGLAHMFTMMNAARLSVGLQGLGVAEAALQSAGTYARERLQGRAPGAGKGSGRGPEPLTVQPDVRRRLHIMRALTEGGRALAYEVGALLDESLHHPDATARARASDRLAVLTPILKAALSDIGFEVANAGIQLHGGHGYIREQGVEQLARDVRIASIYEGTNAIQARDLVGRKLSQAGGAIDELIDEAAMEAANLRAHADLLSYGDALAAGADALRRTTAWLRAEGDSPEAVLAGACDYLDLFALVLLGGIWGRMARAAIALDGDDAAFGAAKLATASVFFTRILPRATALEAAVLAGPVPPVPEAEQAA